MTSEVWTREEKGQVPEEMCSVAKRGGVTEKDVEGRDFRSQKKTGGQGNQTTRREKIDHGRAGTGGRNHEMGTDHGGWGVGGGVGTSATQNKFRG